jgi:hypothetical protein
MAKHVEPMNLFTYRFHARFWQGYDLSKEPIHMGGLGFSSMEVGAKHCGVRMTPLGFEVWTAHRVGQPTLFSQLHVARRVEVVMYSRDPEKKSRVFVLDVAKPKHLPFRLDAMESSVAQDGVLFEDTTIVSVNDELREWPPEEEEKSK